MRLINTKSFDMREFVSDDEIPTYAILSHTWNEEEVSFQHWETRGSVDITSMKGYVKIQNFVDLAAKEGYEWAWVDT